MRYIRSIPLLRSSARAVALGVFVAFGALSLPVATLAAQDPGQPYAQGAAASFSPDQLDNLVAPIALYPDPLLAQVLLAATFPDQVADAAAYVRANGTDGIDEQYWDVSVKAVAHYPTVLNMMDQRIDWTTTLGQAYAQQSTDLMGSVQHMRALARAQGNLVDTPQQQVVYDAGNIAIWPARARIIYVPVYDPAVVYFRPVFRYPGPRTYFSFGVGYPIGAWLIYDWNWSARRIYYTGWYGGGWIARSRPYIRVTTVYVNTRYRRPYWNPEVIYHRPDYTHVRVYAGIGRNVRFHDRPYVRPPRGGVAYGGGQHTGPAPRPPEPRVATPRTGHGRVTPGGYVAPRTGPAGSSTSWTRSLPSRVQPPPHVDARPPVTPTRTARPRVAEPRAQPQGQYAPRVAPAPRAVPRTEPRAAPRAEPRAVPRAAPRVAPRAAPRAAPRSAPQAAPQPARTAHRRPPGNG